jgi:heterodisulfide reductase subunit B
MHNGESMMKVGYYPGCSLHATAREYEESLKAIGPVLDVHMEEIEDWACCGASSAHATNHLLSVSLPARTLMLAERQNLDTIFAPCAACYNRLASAQYALEHDKKTASKVQSILDCSFDRPLRILSIAQLLSMLTDEIQSKSTAQLKGVKVACYYGCLLVRPPEICGFDDPEAPSSLEKIARAAGAAPVEWNMKLECCGGGFSLSRTASVVRLSRSILQSARNAGAQALIVACPMCHSNLDFRQQAIQRGETEDLSMPILYISQLVGLSLGLDPSRLGLNRHYVNPLPFLNRIAATGTAPERMEQA